LDIFLRIRRGLENINIFFIREEHSIAGIGHHRVVVVIDNIQEIAEEIKSRIRIRIF
jgi:molybdopterin-biosynthesis enzyme MoeA-like protein